jgi:kynurenine formamidase
MRDAPPIGDDVLVRWFDECSNKGRWGDDDEIGTLNYITAEKRLAAAALVKTGEVVSVAHDISPQVPNHIKPMLHIVWSDEHWSHDYLGFATHGRALTHLDGLGHVNWGETVYNGRKRADNRKSTGLDFGSVYPQRKGIFARGILLDVAASQGVPWLSQADFITPDELEVAETFGNVKVASGDVLFVRAGVQAREAAEGLDKGMRTGLHASCVPWLHRREVAVYSGDVIEKAPYPSKAMPFPLHQIGIASMGLVLLDNANLEELSAACNRNGRYSFLVTAAPLPMPRVSGCPVNPLAIF